LITAENHWTTSQSSAALRTSGSGDRHGGNLWDGWLRSTLLGEYVSLFILAMALMAVNARSVCAVSSFSVRLAFAAMAGILISVWAVGRSVGLLAGRAWAALVNVALVLVAVGVFGITSTKTPEWLMYGPIGRASLLALLLFVLFLDGMDFVSARSRQISLPDIRRLKGRCLLVAVGTIGSLWSVGVPLLQSMWWTAPTGGKPQLEQMGFFEHVGFRFGEALVTFCFFLLGANIGRQLLERSRLASSAGAFNCDGRFQLPLVQDGNLAPGQCADLGLFLGGECRNCKVSISPSYPTVEAITGGFFLLMFFVELISGGANLPLRSVNSYRGVLWIIMYAKWDLISLYFYHCFVFCSLLTWVRMLRDGNQIPRRMKIFFLSVTVTAPILWNHLWLVPVDLIPIAAASDMRSSADASAIMVFSGILTGGILALALAATMSRYSPGATGQPAASSTTWFLLLVGVAFGWQAVLVTFVIAMILRRTPFPGHAASRFSTPTAVVLGAIIHHVFWRILSHGV